MLPVACGTCVTNRLRAGTWSCGRACGSNSRRQWQWQTVEKPAEILDFRHIFETTLAIPQVEAAAGCVRSVLLAMLLIDNLPFGRPSVKLSQSSSRGVPFDTRHHNARHRCRHGPEGLAVLGHVSASVKRWWRRECLLRSIPSSCCWVRPLCSVVEYGASAAEVAYAAAAHAPAVERWAPAQMHTVAKTVEIPQSVEPQETSSDGVCPTRSRSGGEVDDREPQVPTVDKIVAIPAISQSQAVTKIAETQSISREPPALVLCQIVEYQTHSNPGDHDQMDKSVACGVMVKRERERERERERGRETERERETERQRDRETERQRDREGENIWPSLPPPPSHFTPPHFTPLHPPTHPHRARRETPARQGYHGVPRSVPCLRFVVFSSVRRRRPLVDWSEHDDF